MLRVYNHHLECLLWSQHLQPV